MDLLERINRHLRQLAPHQKERAGMMMLVDARDEILKLQNELKSRDNCAFIGAMRDCPTHGESEQIKRLRKLATCDCGDEFTEHDSGTCVNCLM